MSDRSKIVLILVTAPDGEVAERLARTLVTERLVACVNIVPGLRSHYWWEGEVQSSDEVLLVMKGRGRDVQSVAKRVSELHPYSVPEVIATEVVDGLEAYLGWITSETERD
jgi:periplasmic divalent cation tolerance protein